MSTAATAKDSEQELSKEDHEVISGVERALEGGIELKEWWEGIDRAEREGSESYRNKFKEAWVYNRPEDHSYGFFETADLKQGRTEIIGNVQEQLFHRPKAGSAEFVQSQVREFVLRYFMRISEYRTPQPEPEGTQWPAPLNYLNQYPKADDYQLQGFGYSQRYYKRRDSSEVGKFAESERLAILDLRDLRDHYDWVLVRNPIVDFAMSLRALGFKGPDLSLPIPTAANWLALSPDTITIDENPGRGLLARYGIGYAFMKDPGAPGMFAFGPGQLEPTAQTLTWEVHENGDVIVRMCFVSNAPDAILNVSINPLDWGLHGHRVVYRRAVLEVSQSVASPGQPASVFGPRVRPGLPLHCRCQHSHAGGSRPPVRDLPPGDEQDPAPHPLPPALQCRAGIPADLGDDSRLDRRSELAFLGRGGDQRLGTLFQQRPTRTSKKEPDT